MAGINFSIKKADKKGLCPIYLTFQQKGQKFRYYTKLKTTASGWNGSRVKMNYTGYAEINSILDDLENNLKEIEREAIFNKKEYNLETFKRKFFSRLGGLNSRNDFFTAYDKFIEDSKTTKSNATIRAYKCSRRKLEKFSKAKNYPISFETIDFNFYEAYMSYMLKDRKHLNNAAGKYIKNLKVFLNYAVDHELTDQTYNLKKFKVFNEEADTIYLTESELMLLYENDNLPKRLLQVKDVFCFSCFTGLRFSDVSKLNNTHIKGSYLEIKTEKTKDSLKVPLNDFAKSILDKYKGRFKDKPLPTGISNQKTNAFLKEIGQLCGLTDPFRVEQFSGSQRKITYKQKFEVLTTHTARRTFVTLALEKGIRAEVVMAMTGHRNYRSFMRYVKITDKVKEQEMNRAWNKNLLKAV